MVTAHISTPPKPAKHSKTNDDIIRSYLRSIGRIPLLTPEDEITLGQQVQRWMALSTLQRELTQSLGHPPTLQQWADHAHLSEGELQKGLQQGQRAKRQMIEANLRLVVSIAKKYSNRNLDLTDLIQEGSIGLERAVEKFDPSRGYKFSTYAYWWIRQAITRAIADQSRTIRLPIHCTEQLNKIKRIQRELSQTLGRTPNTTDVAQALNVSPQQVWDILQMARPLLSLEAKVGDNEDTELQDLLPERASSPEEIFLRDSFKQDVLDSLNHLTQQQRAVIILRYGLLDGKELSLSKAGERLGISRERVRQLQNAALKQLRQCHNDLQGYLVS